MSKFKKVMALVNAVLQGFFSLLGILVLVNYVFGDTSPITDGTILVAFFGGAFMSMNTWLPMIRTRNTNQ